ncbi:N-acetyltransferase [Rhodovastum atsumiense]|uniref:N-acetyltransferase n=1 Tax=Rhodovastum atsumiense TaxID=504468 RepID=A0A5M6IM97_9PROT|nr:GNAT family N-acetyltransferase [Rhodovastum atsumiense]KAA5609362.1 N-acetyltransferase [Rhodovastum atsumiense]CAH2598574.1 N-acetyltransferase [Rhodovastum atsumiense]
MPDGSTSLSLTLHKAIADIAPSAWDGCGGEGNPFVSHAFLSAIEDSGSAGARTGWLPQHAVLRDGKGHVVAVAPMYAKSHSYGEYVFDHGWAHAFERAGGQYYPKLQIASPFSPVPGPRLLTRSVPPAALAEGLAQACAELGLSSAHVTFCTEAEWQALGEAGWLQRTGMQFHWQNAGYGDFEGFLAALNARKRKSIRRERRDAQNCGLEFVTLRGGDIGRRDWDAFYGFYTSTVDRKWGSAYLTRRFFTLLGERLGEKVVLMMARSPRGWEAGALNLMGADTLYGRNWGCRGEWPFLHFELCYYRAIAFAIEQGLARVEAGAQGEHKIQRGYLPQPTWSAHWIAHPALRRAVAEFLDQERAQKIAEMAALAEFSPFRHAGETD